MEDNKEEKYIGDKLEDVINENLDELSKTKKGSNEYAAIVNDTKVLGDLWVDIKRVECEYNDRNAQREHEEKMKREETKHSNKSHIVEVAVTTGITAGIAVFRGLLAKKMFMSTLRCEYCDDRALLNRNFQGLFNSTWRP